jgi:hypothetical protein
VTGAPLGPEERIRRNRSIAERFFEAYHRSVERGALVGAFDPDDFADRWTFCSPFLSGELPQERNTHLADGATLNHATISARIPDYRMDHLLVFPTEDGLAWRWCVHGTGIDGQPQEFWELLFAWTDDRGQITRFEFFDDWHGFPQSLAFSYDASIEAITRTEHYGSDPWPPPPPFALDPPDPLGRPVPSSEAARRNLELGRTLGRLLDPRAGAGLDWPEASFNPRLIVFSPWFGARVVTVGALRAALDVAYASLRERLPDLRSDTFDVWPADAGWAWRRRLAGTSVDGVAYECWEQGFASTDAAGRVERLELYFDWQGFPQLLGFATGCSLAELWDVEVVARELGIEL